MSGALIRKWCHRPLFSQCAGVSCGRCWILNFWGGKCDTPDPRQHHQWIESEIGRHVCVYRTREVQTLETCEVPCDCASRASSVRGHVWLPWKWTVPKATVHQLGPQASHHHGKGSRALAIHSKTFRDRCDPVGTLLDTSGTSNTKEQCTWKHQQRKHQTIITNLPFKAPQINKRRAKTNHQNSNNLARTIKPNKLETAVNAHIFPSIPNPWLPGCSHESLPLLRTPKIPVMVLTFCIAIANSITALSIG